MSLTLKIKGGTWPQRVLVHTGALFYAKRLKGFERKHPTINLILAELERKKGESQQNTKRSYTIRLDSRLRNLALIRVLAHEMIHVAQYLSGQLEDLEPCGIVRWGKRKYDMGRVKYEHHPWEIQAFKLEKKLAKQFIELWAAK